VTLPDCPYRGVNEWVINRVPSPSDVPENMCGATCVASIKDLLYSASCPAAFNCKALLRFELCPEGWR